MFQDLAELVQTPLVVVGPEGHVENDQKEEPKLKQVCGLECVEEVAVTAVGEVSNADEVEMEFVSRRMVRRVAVAA